MTDLERALLELEVDWPATPDIAAAVRVRVESEPAPAAGRAAWWRRGAGAGAGRRAPLAAGWRARLAYAAAALVLVGGGTLAASPAARSDVLRWLGLKSVEIRREAPKATPRPRSTLGRTLDLGRPIALAQADRALLRVPAALGDPDAVYATTLPDRSRAVSLVYAPRAGLRASDVTGVALLVQTFRATVSPFIQKTVGSAAGVGRLDIDGARAYWITGAHGFAYQATNGFGFEDQRLADRTLLMERDGLLYRIEGRLSRVKAVAIARSLP
jgi:hypothetical protein